MPLSDVEQSLSRKFGPLPAWAWALVGGVGIYVYRNRQAGQTAIGTVTAPSVTGPTPADPMTVSPGDSVYDPATGTLTGTAPEQQPTGVIDRPTPVTLEPGETLYDPATGTVVGNPAPPDSPSASPPSAAPPRSSAKRTKRTPKGKPQHSKPRPVGKSLSGHAHRPRGTGKLTHSGTHGAAGKREANKPVERNNVPRGKARGPAPSGQRTRKFTPRGPAIRQRPAAPRVTSHVTQRSAPHPQAPARRPAPRRRHR